MTTGNARESVKPQPSHISPEHVTRAVALPQRICLFHWWLKVRTTLTAVVFLAAFAGTSSAAPPVTSGLTVWLDATDPAGNGTTPANGASVSTLVNKASSNPVGNFTALGGSSTYPTYTASSSAFNNKPVISFVSTGKLLGNTYNFGNTVTVIYVGRIGTNKARLLSSDYNVNGGNWLLGYGAGT